MAIVTKGKTFVNGELVTPAKIHQLVDAATVANIVNADIASTAAISDTKLAQITTAGKVANSATTAQHNNTPNTIVARNASGDFFANTITAALSGNASTATKLATARTLSLNGDVSGSVSFDGSANATLTATVLDDSHAHVISNVDGLQSALDSKAAAIHTHAASYITSGTLANARTTADSANTANSIVARDASGNFSAGTITAALSGNASTATKLATARTISLTGDVTGSATFDGSANASITAVVADDSHNHTIANVDGLQTALDGKLATTGNASTASKLATARTITLGGDLSGSVSFDGSANATLTAAVLDDSHAHVIANVDGLQTALDGKAASAHTHDDRYYTESEVNNLLAGKASISHFHTAASITNGTLDNARTTADSANTANSIVARDASGNFSAGTITAALSGNASTATKLATARTISLTGDVTGSATFNGSANASITAVIVDGSHNHSATNITSGTLSNARTTATIENTANTIVARGPSGGTAINWLDAYSPGANSGIYNVYAPGNIYVGGLLSNGTNTGIVYSTGSDYRLKTDLEKLTGAMARLSALPVHRFKWVGHPAAPKVDGFLAHEAQAVVPESVTGTKDAVDADGKPIYQGIDQSKLVPLLVAAVQELAARVEALEAK